MRRLATMLLIGLPALAQESGGSVEKPGMIIWQVINFFILVGFLGWIVSKQGKPALMARSKGIVDGLSAGEKAKAEAEARAKEVQAKLDNLDKEITVLRSDAHQEREREEERIRREIQNEIARIHAQAELEIEASGKQARREVQRAAAMLAIELAENKVRARMSAEAHSALLEGFLKDLAGGATRERHNAG